MYSKSLANLILYFLDKVRPDPTAASTATVVAIAKLENFLRDDVFGAFGQENPLSAHALLESTVRRWLDGTRRELGEQMRATAAQRGAQYGSGGGGATPGCELQDVMVPALRNRLRVYEAIVTALPLTATLVEKTATDVRSRYLDHASTLVHWLTLSDAGSAQRRGRPAGLISVRG